MVKFFGFVTNNQWKGKRDSYPLGAHQIDLVNIGWACDQGYGQGDHYTFGVVLLGFAVGVSFMVLHKD